MTKVTLWLQTNDVYKHYLWDFCAISEIGAREWQIPYKKFYKSSEIPYSPYNVVIGSVEEYSSYLEKNGHKIPAPINMSKMSSFSGRSFRVINKKEFLKDSQKYMKFVKDRWLQITEVLR